MSNAVKFGRRYQLKVETQPREDPKAPEIPNRFTTIELPFTCEFEVRRNFLASANTAIFRIFNLKENSRNQVYKDRYDVTEFRAVQFRAGYDDNPPMIFNGTVRQAYSYRASGSTEFVTEIDCFDGGFAMVNGDSNLSLVGGQTYTSLIQQLSKDLPGVNGTPIVGDFSATAKRGVVFVGNTWKLIQQLTQGNATIDNGQLKALQPNEAINGDIAIINADTGLLGSPKRTEAMLELDMLFTPQLTLGQIIKLESVTNRVFNGYYKVMGFTHTGTISPSVGGTAQTKVMLWMGTQTLRVLRGRGDTQ